MRKTKIALLLVQKWRESIKNRTSGEKELAATRMHSSRMHTIRYRGRLSCQAHHPLPCILPCHTCSLPCMPPAMHAPCHACSPIMHIPLPHMPPTMHAPHAPPATHPLLRRPPATQLLLRTVINIGHYFTKFSLL